jgi:hypothetical protein
MKVFELMALLEDMPLHGEVWISDQQGRYVPANNPYEADGEESSEYGDGEESPQVGDVIISFENT